MRSLHKGKVRRFGRRLLSMILVAVMVLELIPETAYAAGPVNEPKEIQEEKNVFQYYGLIAAKRNLQVTCSEGYFESSLYTGQDFICSGSTVNIEGTIEAAGSIQQWCGNFSSAGETEQAGQIVLPDLRSGIEAKSDIWEEQDSYLNVNGEEVHNGFKKSSSGIQISGTHFVGDCFFLAEDSIQYSVDSLNKDGGRVVLYSENGDISISGSDIVINGILAAPNGTVRINADNITLNGRIYAAGIEMSAMSINVYTSDEDLDLIQNEAEVIKIYDIDADFEEGVSEGITIQNDVLSLTKSYQPVTFAETYNQEEKGVSAEVTLNADRLGEEGSQVHYNIQLKGMSGTYPDVKAADIYFQNYNGNLYAFINKSLRWDAAKKFCEDCGGHLVTISSEQEMKVLTRMVQAKGATYTAIGFSDEEEEGNWRWVTGEEVVYTNWNPGEPNSGRMQNHAYMYNSGLWDDGFDYITSPFLCEWEKEDNPLLPAGRNVELVVEVNGTVEEDGDWECIDNGNGTTTVVYFMDQIMPAADVSLDMDITLSEGEGYQEVIKDSYYIYYDASGKGHRIEMGDVWLPVYQHAETGTWKTVYDSEREGTTWKKLWWEALQAGDSSIKAHVKAYDTAEGESTEAEVINGTELEGVKGRYIEIEVTLQRGQDFRSPVLDKVILTSAKAADSIELTDQIPAGELLCNDTMAAGQSRTGYFKVTGGLQQVSSETEWTITPLKGELSAEDYTIEQVSPYVVRYSIRKEGSYQLNAVIRYGKEEVTASRRIVVRKLSELKDIESLIAKEDIKVVLDMPDYGKPGETITGNIYMPGGEIIQELKVLQDRKEIETADGSFQAVLPEAEGKSDFDIYISLADDIEIYRKHTVYIDNTAPIVNIVPEKEDYANGETGRFHLEVQDESPLSSYYILFDDIEIMYRGGDVIEINNLTAGEHTLMVRVADMAGNEGEAAYTFDVLEEDTGSGGSGSGDTPVTDPSDKTAPVIAIISPEQDAVLTDKTDIIGTVTDNKELDYYTLEYAEEGSDEYQLLTKSEEQIENGVLGTLDTTMLRNGRYTIKLTAMDKGGNGVYAMINVIVEGNLKVGAMHIGFTDITAQMGGTTVSVNRMYDSRNKNKGDFGIGWTLGMQGLEIYESKTPLSDGYSMEKSGSLFSVSYQMVETANHDVVVTYGDGTSDRFELTFTPEKKALIPISETKLGYRCVTNQKVKLEIVGDTTAYVSGTELMFYDESMYDTLSYKLTTADGVEIYIKAGKGVYKMVDKDDNTITVDENGYHAEDGRSVTFKRDSKGRIVEAKDPAGKVTSYKYDGNGDLVSVTDPAERTVTFTYDKKHNLASITDPMGVAVARNEYDDDGRLIATIDADGNRTEYEHDVDGRMEVIADRLGNKTVYVYDDQGNVLSTTDANGKTTKSTYDSYGNVLTKTDAKGNITAYAYDASGNMTSVTDADGNILKNTYNGNNQVTSMKALGDTEILIDYDEKGHLTGTTDAEGNETTYSYDRKGNVTGITDELGKVMSAKYDSEGNAIESIDSAGNKITSTFDASGNRLTQTTYVVTENGTEERTTHYIYDDAGELIQTVDADGNATSVERNGNGMMSAAVDSKGRRTEYEYDNRGNVTKIIYSDGTTEEFEYDAEDRNTKTISRTGLVTRYSYDKVGNLLKQTDARGNTVTYTYDSNYNLLTTIDAAGAVTTYAYDKLNRNTSITDDEGNITSFAYNGLSLQTSTTDAKGKVTEYKYDDNGNRTKVIYPNGNEIETRYDERGRTIWQKDAEGRKTEYTYDDSDRLIKVEQPNGAVTNYTYDQKGNLTAIEDANGNVTQYKYDVEGRRTKVILADGSYSTSKYDKQGMLIETTDYNQVKTTYTYDDQDRIVKEQTGSEYTAYEYDTYGRLTGLKTKNSQTAYSYNKYSELEQKTYENGEAVRYLYDKYGRTSEIQVLSSDKVQTSTKYEYDKMSRLTRVVGRNGEATVYTYDANGNRETATFANGVKLTYTYDDLNRLILQQMVYNSGNAVVQYQYTLGKNGERTHIEEKGPDGTIETDYKYDKANRLVKETIQTSTGKTTYEYSYVKVGNRTSKEADGVKTVYTYDSRNRLAMEKTGDNTVTYHYDANGNLLKQSAGTDTIYTYDVYNRLTAYQQGEKKESYTYDAEGVRRSKTSGGETTYFVSDTSSSLSQTLAETDGKGKVKAEYTRADSLTAQVREGKVSYYFYDGHGDVRGLLNTEGRVTDTYRYNAYGELIAQTGDTENHYLYTGEYYDAASNLYYLRARYMNPSTGNFLTMDTYEGSIYDPDTLHKYMYANGNPVMYTDPTGNFSMAAQAAAMAINDTISAAYNLHLTGLLSGIINMAAQSYLGGEEFDLVKSFFDGYKAGIAIAGLRYVGAMFKLQALVDIFLGVIDIKETICTMFYIASCMDDVDQTTLVIGTLVVTSFIVTMKLMHLKGKIHLVGDKGDGIISVMSSDSDGIIFGDAGGVGKSSSNTIGNSEISTLLDGRQELTGTTRDKLMATVQDSQLRSIVNELYRPGATVGDGGTADILVWEYHVGSSKHLIKAKARLTQLNRLADSGIFNLNDWDILDALRIDLENAISLYD